MESGSSSPSVKSFEVAGLSTSALAVEEVSNTAATVAVAAVAAAATIGAASHTGSAKVRKTSPIAETKAAIANHIASATNGTSGGGGGGEARSKYRSNTTTMTSTATTTATATTTSHNPRLYKARSPSSSYAMANKKSLGPVKFRNLICTTGTERLNREFRDVKCSGMPQVRELKLCDNNLFHWKFLLLPDMAPYNKNAFQAEIKFPTSYPQMAPIITVHNIYHPNVDEKGFVCLHCLSHWSRTTKIEDVLQKLFALIRDPEPHHPMRFDVADEYLKDRKVFMHKAFEAAKAFGVPRPKF